MSWPRLIGDRLVLRPPAASDNPALTAILSEDEVSRWWVGYDAGRVQAEVIDSGNALVIEIGGVAAGAIFLYPNDDPEYRHVVIHLFLGEAFGRQRYGAEALVVAIDHLATLGHHRFTLDPNVNNAPAIRSYERLGFTRVGVLRQYQLRPEGHFEDGLLMDLVLGDFPQGMDWRRG
jgi:aminoglycoside 6'-N-acetyltransferase